MALLAANSAADPGSPVTTWSAGLEDGEVGVALRVEPEVKAAVP